mgnify:FL=1
MRGANLRVATEEDAMLLLRWANDAVTRANSINTHEICIDEHMAWFNRKLKDENCHLYIYEYQGIPVGQVRVDIWGDEGTISYSIDANYRGKGYGSDMISLVEEIENKKLNKLIAIVKKENIASSKVFEHNDFAKAEMIHFEKVIDNN